YPRSRARFPRIAVAEAGVAFGSVSEPSAALSFDSSEDPSVEPQPDSAAISGAANHSFEQRDREGTMGALRPWLRVTTLARRRTGKQRRWSMRQDVRRERRRRAQPRESRFGTRVAHGCSGWRVAESALYSSRPASRDAAALLQYA